MKLSREIPGGHKKGCSVFFAVLVSEVMLRKPLIILNPIFFK
jgi:hypothetical protein